MTKAQQKRLVNWRLKALRHEREVTQNISLTCRHFGVSRRWFYKWRARYAAHGGAGLCDESTAPRRSPRATPREVVSKVLYLRQNYHFGPGKIRDYLGRFHRVSLATATVHRILQRHGMAGCRPTRRTGSTPSDAGATRSSSPANGSRWT